MLANRLGDAKREMLIAVTLLFPLMLLTFLLLMERVEQPLREDAVGEQLERFLDTARPDEVETLVSEGFAQALDRYWRRRRRLASLRPGRAGHR